MTIYRIFPEGITRFYAVRPDYRDKVLDIRYQA